MKGLIVAVAFLLASCAPALQQLGNTVFQTASQMLCAEAFAEARGVSLEDALKLYCANAEDFEPFNEPARRAKAAGRSARE